MSALHNLMKVLDAAAQDMVPPDLKAQGWRYQDFPGKFSPEAWGWLRAWIGEGEYKIIVYSTGENRAGEPWVRGQMFISPQGYENLRNRERGKAITRPEAP